MHTYYATKSKILEKTLNILGCHIYWKDKQGKFVWCNKRLSDVLGLKDPKEIKNKTDYDLYNANLAKKVVELDRKVLTTGKEYQIDEAGLDLTGNLAVYLTIKTPLKDEFGNVEGLIGISIDITKQKQAHIAKQEFLQNMAHDIRTPLAGIIGLAQLQEMGLESLEESKEYGQMIQGAGSQLLELLNAVIKLIDTKHMTDSVKTELLDLSGFAKELCALMEPSIYTKRLKFKLEIDPNLPLVLTDCIKLKRLLLNILSNAVKFTKVGQINFSIKLLDIENNSAKIEIRITDTGIGIAKENLGKIFDRFYRVHPSYLAEYTGHGIGLYLVKEILAILDGEIKVSSEEGKGTCFTLYFKFLLADKPLDKAETVLTYSSIQAKAGPVLIAEDNALVLHVVKNLLEKAGYKVIAAKDGQAALEALKTNSIAWALLDIGLPKLRGTEACRQHREWEKENSRHRLPIFALTGHQVEDIQKECNEAGIDKVFTKPFKDEVIQEVDLLINNFHFRV